jgi:hypothetical protein
MPGLTSVSNSPDDAVTLNSSYNWSYGQDVINALTHEISEGGLGRIGGLGDQNSLWSVMDLFRYNSSGAADYTDGRDGRTTYFSYNGGATLSSLAYNNEYNGGSKVNGGDTADFTPVDVFGTSFPGETNSLSATDIQLMEALGWSAAPHAVLGNVNIEAHGDFNTEPGRLFPSNVALEPLTEDQQAEKFSVRLAATGAAAEHYLMIATELAESGEYLLQMQIQPNNAAAVRIQAWDKDLQPNGVLADLHFGSERVSTHTINRSEASLGQVVRRDQWYDLAIGVRLPAGLSRVLIQLMAPNDNNVFAANSQSLQIRKFAIRRSLGTSQ